MMDTTLNGIKSINTFLDDIIIISKGTLENHKNEIDKTLKRLDKENLAISLHKCEFGLTEITWLGYKINSDGIITTKRKTDAIIQLENPKTLKQLRSFMGSIHHLVKFIPNLATLSAPLRPLLTKSTNKTPKKLEWEDKHTSAFNKIKEVIGTIVEQKHFDIKLETRVKCDASKEGLGACLEQKQNNTWHPIAYASRFLNTNEQRYCINELELLAVVWSLEHFKYYLYGSHFTLQTDHQALLSALKNNRGNKTYQSRLTRWVDRLLPFHFKVEHNAGKNMGFADYLSRHPNSQPTGENIDKNHVINTIEAIHYTLHTTHRKLTNQNARKRRTLNDVTNHSNLSKTKQNAFRHLHATNQLSCLALNKPNEIQSIHNHISPNSVNTIKSINPNQLYKSYKSYNPDPLVNHLSSRTNLHFNSNPPINKLFRRKIYVTTRSKPHINTYTIPIKKRQRGPNKNKSDTMSETQLTNTIATQTEETSNIGQGRKPLTDMQHFNPIPEIDHENSPDYLKQL